MKKVYQFSGFVLGILLCLQACKEQEALEPIVCPEANFRMEIEIADTLLPVDTVFNNNLQVQFTASDLYETYHWKVGIDERTWTDQSFGLYFNNTLGDIKVTFIGKRKTIEGCEMVGEEEEIIDTLVRNLHVKNLPDPFVYPAPEPYLYEGTWRGVFEDTPEDIFEFKIIDFGPGYSGKRGLKSFNFPQNCANYEVNEETKSWYSPSLGPQTYKHFGLEINRSLDFIGCEQWYRVFGVSIWY